MRNRSIRRDIFVFFAVFLLGHGITAAAPLTNLLPFERPGPTDEENLANLKTDKDGLIMGLAFIIKGDPVAAVEALSSRGPSELDDYGLYFMARAKVALEDYHGALKSLDELLTRYQNSRWRDPAELMTAICLWRTGDRDKALSNLSLLLGKKDSSLAPWAAAFRTLWKREAKDQTWIEDLDLLAEAGLDHDAAVFLEEQWEESLIDLIDLNGLLKTIPILYNNRATDLLFQTVDRAAILSQDPFPEEILSLVGQAAHFTRRNDQAEETFQTLLKLYPSSSFSPKASYHLALLNYRRGTPEGARQGFKKLIERYPKSYYAQQAARSLGRDIFRNGDRAEARKMVGELISRAGSKATFDLIWCDLWMAYRDDDRAYFTEKSQQALQNWSENDQVGRLTYWRHRVGDQKENIPWDNLASQFPISFWGTMARWRAGDREGTLLEAGIKNILPLLKTSSPPSTDNARANLLAEMGLFRFAADEAQDDKMAKAWFLYQAGDYYDAICLSAGRIYQGKANPIELWEITYPEPYKELVTSVAEREGVDPALVYAIMREESHFDRRTRSLAGARGLMQLYPPTTLADFPNLASTPDDLMDIKTNITIGTRLLGRLLKAYGGELIPAIAAYNAGKGAVDTWLSRGKDLEIDEFIEEISYDETQAYVGRVLPSLAVYRALALAKENGS